MAAVWSRALGRAGLHTAVSPRRSPGACRGCGGVKVAVGCQGDCNRPPTKRALPGSSKPALGKARAQEGLFGDHTRSAGNPLGSGPQDLETKLRGAAARQTRALDIVLAVRWQEGIYQYIR